MLTQNNPSIEEVLSGINQAAKIITSTMGGGGKNVLMYKNGNLAFTKDGVSVAREIGFDHIEQNAGAQLLINAADKTVSECGDGTTLTSLLTQQFVEYLFKETQTRDVNDVLDEARLLIENVKKYLLEVSKPIDSAQDIYNIAFTSCKNNNLADLIKQMFVKTGLDANVSVEKSNHSRYTYLEYTEGLTFDEGYVNGNFATEDSGLTIYENPLILVENDYINTPSDISEIIEVNHVKNTPVVFIAKGFSDHVIRYCLTNVPRGVKVCLIKLPGWGEQQKENIKDINVFLSENYTCNRIVVTPYKFTIFNNPNKTKIKRRVKTLTRMLDNAAEEWEVKEYKDRIENIQQKSVIIYVGGVTEKNQKEEFDRIEDAVGAVKSAAKQGYVKGAGTALLEYAQRHDLPQWFYNVLNRPAYQILENANLNFNPVFIPYNTRTKQLDESLTDPTFVICSALDNSFALAELLINTSYILYES